jgi:serine/threonine protein phosphatase 1
MTEKYIAIGDIHGCPEELLEVLDLTKEYKDHKYVFLGDYIDRGPDSEAVINILKNLDAIFLLGNHDLMLVEQIKRWGDRYFGDSFLRTKITKASVDWLMNVPIPVYESNTYIFVHAGFNIEKDIKNQTLHDYLWSREQGNYYELTDKIVIHGHTIVEKPITVGNRININTGCGSKGRLTAVVLPEMIYYQSKKSPGLVLNWEEIKQELIEELKQYDTFSELEEVD